MKTDVLRLALISATAAFLLSVSACSPKPEEHAEESAAAPEHAPGELPDEDATARQDAEAAVAAAMAASPTATETLTPSAGAASHEAPAHEDAPAKGH